MYVKEINKGSYKKFVLIPLYKKDGKEMFVCHYCHDHFPKDQMTKDHKNPLSESGQDHIENIVPACLSCNKNKADIPYDKFISIINEFGHNLYRFELPKGSTNYQIIDGGLLYYNKQGVANVINGVDKVGGGCRILTTYNGKNNLHILTSISK